MGKKKTTTITRETHEVLIFRRTAGRPVRLWCAGCAAEVEMLTPEEAALLAGVSTRTIYRRADAGQVHFSESPEGFLLVCPNSVAR